MAAGNLTPITDKTHLLNATAKAMRHLEAGHVCGKVVFSVGE